MVNEGKRSRGNIFANLYQVTVHMWRAIRGDMWQDIRYGWRGLRRDRAFTAVALLTLTLGIGATTAIFSIVDAVLIRSLPYPEAGRLVAVWPNSPFLRAEYVMARDGARTFEELAAYQEGVGFSLSGDGVAQRVTGAYITHNLLPLLGVNVRGQNFTEADGRRAQPDVVLLSHALWRDRYGSDPGIVGRRILIDGAPHTVQGILPAGFGFPDVRTALWVPLTLDPAQTGLYWGLGGTRAIGRLRAGATADQAEAELHMIADEMRTANPLWTPEAPYRTDAVVEPLQETLVASSRTMLLVLLGAVLLVLLIACANVANLSLARGLARERNIAVCIALGAERARIVRQLVIENVLLALLGGVLGIGLAWSTLRAIVAFVPANTPRLSEVQLDARVLAFAFAVSFGAGLLFGVFPALRIARHGSNSLREDGRAGTSIGKRRLSSAVVVAEVALAVVLIAGAGLLLQTLANLGRINTGFTREQIITARISPTGGGYDDAPRRNALFEQIQTRLSGMSTVSEVALTSQLPFDGELNRTAAAVEFVTTNPNDLPTFDHRAVTPSYFDALEIPILEGRAFDSTDRPQAQPVAIVDQATAARFWPGESAIGKRIGRPWMREWRTIVGVVGNVRNNELRTAGANALYVPLAQDPARVGVLVVRSAHAPEPLAATIRNVVQDIDPNVPVSDIQTLERMVTRASASERAAALLIALFAILALTLGAVGLYGVLAYAVTQRRRELGIRLALGATRESLLTLVLREGLGLGVLGLLLGVPAALGLNRLMQGLLFGVEPGNFGNLALVTVVLLATCAAAAVVPAWRAARTPPASVLRE